MTDSPDTRASDLLRRFQWLEGSRGIFEQHWRDIALRILPRSDYFRTIRPQGDKHTEFVFDATANLALERFAAAMESMLTPRTQKWHRLKAVDEELNDDPEVQDWLDQVTNILFAVRYAPKGNFASQANEVYMSLGAFGTGAMFIDEAIGHGIRYRSIHLSELYIDENHQGVVDTIFRKFPMTARQAIQKFGANKVADQIKEIAKTRPDTQFDFLHVVHPNDDIVWGRRDYRGMPFYSCYIDVQHKMIVSEGGFRTMPYAVGRYILGPKEMYGRSPAMTVLPDIKMLNEMNKTVIRAAHKIVDPPLLMQEDGALTSFDLRPGALNFGGVDDQGRQVVHPLATGARVDIGQDMMDQRRKLINDAFLVTLFQILVDSPQMTATEAMLRAQEKGALLAPSMGRQQSELLGPMIERELDILARAGQLPPMPEHMAKRGGMVDVEYVSPLNRAQRAEEGVAILNTIQSITPLAQIDPTVMSIFDPEATARELAEINGVPAKVLRTPDQMKAMQDQLAQANNMQGLLQAAPVASGVAKDMAQAQALAGSAPGQVAPGIFPQGNNA
jgi:Bacteriophage head to tail connecting protein